jgi:hypothetical protein
MTPGFAKVAALTSGSVLGGTVVEEIAVRAPSFQSRLRRTLQGGHGPRSEERRERAKVTEAATRANAKQ